ncbi:hypothetical protein TRVA0_030S00936 [Trichomonascus vanleenenianus]|uniref:uncharacterized protein n=1 Tax=Trichomonascus vanleenenianus TaxID=2268995 RepID=UPI003EC987CB
MANIFHSTRLLPLRPALRRLIWSRYSKRALPLRQADFCQTPRLLGGVYLQSSQRLMRNLHTLKEKGSKEEMDQIIGVDGLPLKWLEKHEEEFHILLFEDSGGLECQPWPKGDKGDLFAICGYAGAFKPTKFRVQEEDGKYYIKCEHGHFLGSFLFDELSGLHCSNCKPEGKEFVYLEPDEKFRSLFRFRTSCGKYIGSGWYKCAFAFLELVDKKEDGTIFYLKSASEQLDN